MHPSLPALRAIRARDMNWLGLRSRFLTSVLVALLVGEASSVKIFHVNPSIGSIGGGTRMHIQVRDHKPKN